MSRAARSASPSSSAKSSLMRTVAPPAAFSADSSESGRNLLQARSTAANSASASRRAAGSALASVMSSVAVVPKTLKVSCAGAAAATAVMKLQS